MKKQQTRSLVMHYYHTTRVVFTVYGVFCFFVTLFFFIPFYRKQYIVWYFIILKGKRHRGGDRTAHHII